MLALFHELNVGYFYANVTSSEARPRQVQGHAGRGYMGVGGGEAERGYLDGESRYGWGWKYVEMLLHPKVRARMR